MVLHAAARDARTIIGSRFLVAFAAAVLAHQSAAHAGRDGAADSLPADSSFLAGALNGQMLQLTMRGTSVAVIAGAVPAEAGCAALISAQRPGTSRKWNRLFRWSDVAWAGTTPEGAMLVSFFDAEGHLPVDRVVFSPADGPGFRAALARLTTACRAARDEAERVTTAGPARDCYFARLPGLRLVATTASEPPRALLTVLSRETPEAELQLLLERGAPDPAADGDEWGRPAVAFTFADPRLKDMRVAAARFALDGEPVAAEHSVTAFGDTRLRVSMDPFSARARGSGTFYRRLARSGEAALVLLDSGGQSRAVLTFETGPVLSAARKALTVADWSCAGATPTPAPAAHWKPQG